MRAPLLLLLWSANFAFAKWHKPLPGHRSLAGHDSLAARQIVDGGANLTQAVLIPPKASNAVRTDRTVLDPVALVVARVRIRVIIRVSDIRPHHQGAGTTGTDGVVPQTAYSAFYSATTQWPCFPTDTNEDCCHRGGTQWCSGDYPSQVCYDPSSVVCCSNGEVCTGNGCCSSLGAVATTPNPTLATRTGTPTPTGTSGSSTSYSTTGTPTSVSSAPAATTTATKSSNGGKDLADVKGAVGVLGAFLVGLIFL
ncbi:uncharacterized protein N7458_004268 [Penicillium daleae]|uniref:GPI anchored protein n=1 Tax=Penicillium daleae TaxID=63821 RepID=A0AAD6CAQ6_9EURO|nr:uncharacterized protein N7458_004268 [Penicillium daleae]KAJ5456004.1 hypothetical protein N7458_004268 [Penicillium daleae]